MHEVEPGLYIKKLEDVDLKVLRQLVEKAVKKMNPQRISD
jgi:hypothetical protein